MEIIKKSKYVFFVFEVKEKTTGILELLTGKKATFQCQNNLSAVRWQIKKQKLSLFEKAIDFLIYKDGIKIMKSLSQCNILFRRETGR